MFNKKWYQRPGCLFFTVLSAIVLLLAILFGIRILVLAQKIKSGEISVPANFTESSLQQNLSEETNQKYDMVTSDNPTLGLKNAPVTIVEFSDFECPFSRQAFPIIRETTNTFGGKVLYQYRHFPISEIHANAENAVLASECANEQGKFWPYHDKLFQNQDNLAIDSLKAYAAEIGLDEVQFANCFDSGKYESKIKRDRADGLFTGVRGTPTWFIDGVKIEGVIPLDVFRRIIQEQIEIKAKQGAKQR